MDLAKTVDLKETILTRLQDASVTRQSFSNKVENRKAQALESFKRSGFPTTKHEEYKYFNLNKVLKSEYTFPLSSADATGDFKSFLFDDLKANRLVFINGIYSPEHSTIVSSGNELIVSSLQDADQNIIEKYFGREVYSANDPFAELNTASVQNGIFIQVPKNKVVEHPVLIHFIADANQTDVFVQPRVMLLAETNAQVSLLETFHTAGTNTSFTNAVTEIVLHTDAIVDYYKLQNDSASSVHVGNTIVTLEGKSTFNSATITLSGAMVRNNLNVILKAEYSEAHFYGLYFTGDRQVVDNHTMVDHAVPNCESNELYKGILDGFSTGVFNGKIFVKQDAQKTNAFQSNKNILLTKDATMNTKPQLEIFADDVKCSHGATIGQLEEEPLFYLRSRGIGEDSARALLLIAFAQDIIDHIKIDALKEYLSKAIEQRLS